MSILQIKRFISNNIGKKIVIIYDGGRNRQEQISGIIYKAYNNIFLVVTNCNETKSFNYVDILTKTIQIYVEKC